MRSSRQQKELARAKKFLASDALIKIIRSMIDVLYYIHMWGDSYHGNICLDSFYYNYKRGGMFPGVTIKLANFTTNDNMTPEGAKLDDWHKLGSSVINDIVHILEEVPGTTTSRVMLEDLSKFFKKLTDVTDAQKAYKHAFFMNEYDQICFF